ALAGRPGPRGRAGLSRGPRAEPRQRLVALRADSEPAGAGEDGRGLARGGELPQGLGPRRRPALGVAVLGRATSPSGASGALLGQRARLLPELRESADDRGRRPPRTDSQSV